MNEFSIPHNVAYIAANVPLHWAPEESQHLMFAPISLSVSSPITAMEAHALIMGKAIEQFGAKVVRPNGIDDIEITSHPLVGATMNLFLGT